MINKNKPKPSVLSRIPQVQQLARLAMQNKDRDAAASATNSIERLIASRAMTTEDLREVVEYERSEVIGEAMNPRTSINRVGPTGKGETIFGLAARQGPAKSFNYAPLEREKVSIPSLLAGASIGKPVRVGTLSEFVNVDCDFMRSLSANGRSQSTQRKEFTLAASGSKHVWMGPASHACITNGGVNTVSPLGTELVAAGVGLAVNNQNGLQTANVQVEVISWTGGTTRNGGALKGNTSVTEWNIPLGTQDILYIVPQVIQQGGAEHAMLETYGCDDSLIVAGAPQPLKLRDDVTGIIYEPCDVIGSNNQYLGALAAASSPAQVDFSLAGRSFYAISVRNMNPEVGVSCLMTPIDGFYAQQFVDLLVSQGYRD